MGAVAAARKMMIEVWLSMMAAFPSSKLRRLAHLARLALAAANTRDHPHMHRFDNLGLAFPVASSLTLHETDQIG